MIHKVNQLSDSAHFHSLTHYLNALSEMFTPSQICFLDIETTGFDRVKSQITVIGILLFQENKWQLHQIFCKARSDELDVLSKLHQLLDPITCIVTFNGNSFDIPYLKSKCAQHHLESDFLDCCSLDLFDVAKQVYQNQKGLRLKDIERYLGIERTDLISGKEVVDAYYDYLRTRNPKAVEDILLHNYEDILHLPDLLPLLEKLSATPTKVVTPHLLFNHLYMDRAILKEDFLELSLYTKPCTLLRLDHDFQSEYCTYKRSAHRLMIKLPVIRSEGAAILHTQLIFNKPLQEYGDLATQFIVYFNGGFSLSNLNESLHHFLKEMNFV